MIRKEKKGISPVIATVLLVALAIIFAIIIFIWAKSFIEENVLKNDEVVENSCDDVVFSASTESGIALTVTNQGNVAISFAVKKTSGGSEEVCYPLENTHPVTISSGESRGAIDLS